MSLRFLAPTLEVTVAQFSSRQWYALARRPVSISRGATARRPQIATLTTTRRVLPVLARTPAQRFDASGVTLYGG